MKLEDIEKLQEKIKSEPNSLTICRKEEWPDLTNFTGKVYEETGDCYIMICHLYVNGECTESIGFQIDTGEIHYYSVSN